MKSLGHARRGVRHAVSTQRNIRIHLVIAALVIAFGVYLNLNDFELVAIILAISFVLISEMINTSIEEVVNLVTPGKRLRAKIAKDVAAGAVLFSSICAIIIGCLIFIPHLIRR